MQFYFIYPDLVDKLASVLILNAYQVQVCIVFDV